MMELTIQILNIIERHGIEIQFSNDEWHATKENGGKIYSSPILDNAVIAAAADGNMEKATQLIREVYINNG